MGKKFVFFSLPWNPKASQHKAHQTTFWCHLGNSHHFFVTHHFHKYLWKNEKLKRKIQKTKHKVVIHRNSFIYLLFIYFQGLRSREDKWIFAIPKGPSPLLYRMIGSLRTRWRRSNEMKERISKQPKNRNRCDRNRHLALTARGAMGKQFK